jgi:tetratricopeptide (TPR) repeat protein
MRKSRPVLVTASVLLVVFLIGSVGMLRLVDAARPQATLQEVLFISSPKVLKRLSLGYDGLLADVYWTRAVQYFGGNLGQGGRRFDLLAPLLEITTTLDPHLLVAYQFGGNFLAPAPPNGAGMPDRAIALMNYGIQNNPDDWHLYYQLGFIYYMDLKDYKNAADAFERGSKVPQAHPFLKVLAANMAQHAGDIQMARVLWTTTYENTQDKHVRANAIAHLRALQVDDDVAHIQSEVSLYGQKTGQLPASMASLVSARLLPRIPLDPDGNPYVLTAEGRVLVRNPDDFPFITKGTPPGYQAPSPKEFLEKLMQRLP